MDAEMGLRIVRPGPLISQLGRQEGPTGRLPTSPNAL